MKWVFYERTSTYSEFGTFQLDDIHKRVRFTLYALKTGVSHNALKRFSEALMFLLYQSD